MALPQPRRRAGRPSAAISARTRTRVLRAACRCFAAGGYGPTSNQQIAEAAGVTAASLYHYFDSKAELFAAVHDQAVAVLVDAYRRAAATPGRCVDRLCAVVASNGRLNREHAGLAEFLAISPMELRRHPELALLLTRSGDEVTAVIENVIAEGVARGELPADLDRGTAVQLITGSIFGLAWVNRSLEKPALHEGLLDAFQQVLRRGFHAVAPSGRD